MKLAAIKPISLMLGRELGLTALLLLGVSIVVFAILYLAPGNPFSTMLGATQGGEFGEVTGISASWYSQYLLWLGKVLQGDLGNSLRTGLPVAGEIWHLGLNTLILTLGSLLVTMFIAVPIALFGASRGETVVTLPATLVAYVLSALPVFWLGYIVIYVFINMFNMFPLMASGPMAREHAVLYFMVPIFVLGIGNGTLGEIVRTLREEMQRVLAEDYIRTARAKAAPVWRHAFKEGFLLPVTEIIAAKIPFVISGAIIVEQMFNWPGIGRLAWQAAQDRDFPVIMGVALAAAALVRLGSLLQRVVYTAVNPRASQE